MKTEATNTNIVVGNSTSLSPRFQFSLRAMFVVIAVAAIGLAVVPKEVSTMSRLLYVPQLSLTAWACYRVRKPANGVEDAPLLSEYSWFMFALSLGLVLPLTAVLAMMLAEIQVYLNLGFLIACLFSSVITAPLILLLILADVVRRARLPLSLLHIYNISTVIYIYWYIATHLG